MTLDDVTFQGFKILLGSGFGLRRSCSEPSGTVVERHHQQHALCNGSGTVLFCTGLRVHAGTRLPGV